MLTANTWLLTNHWLNFVESTGQMDEQALHRGYLVMLNMIRPYATELGLRDFERLVDPRIEVDPNDDRQATTDRQAEAAPGNIAVESSQQ